MSASPLILAMHRARVASAFPKGWLLRKLFITALGDRKNASGHLPEHGAALSEYASLPWYTRAFKHSRAWYGNKRIALRNVLSR